MIPELCCYFRDHCPAQSKLGAAEGLDVQAVQAPDLSRRFQQVSHTVEVAVDQHLVFEGLQHGVVLLEKLSTHRGGTLEASGVELGQVFVDVPPRSLNSAALPRSDLPQAHSVVLAHR
ncbi:MAG: hypothetical protein FJ077_09485 [Cyanobacteria bacterium K_DeepCast_35m_m2_023]|nr:hypothetical protein [Cyanobacteria bacterium K_DeepCast_35m_m2_023]